MPVARERALLGSPIAIAGGRAIVSPFQFTTEPDDNLRIIVANSAAGVVVALNGWRIDTAGLRQPITETIAAPATRLPVSKDILLGAGAISNLTAFCVSGTPLVGQTYVMVQLLRGFTGGIVVLGTLLAGYVTATQAIGFPGSPIVSSTDGEPAVRAIGGTDPPAGAQFAEQVPTGARWELMSLQVAYTADATVGTRACVLTFNSGGGTVGFTWNPLGIAASTTGLWTWAQGLQVSAAPVPQFGVGGLPVGLRLLAGGQIFSQIINPGVLDNFGPPTYAVREWLEV